MGKLTFEGKINIYSDKKAGKSLSYLCQKYNINSTGIKYLIRLIDGHGFKILRTNNNRKFNKFEKERIINRVLLNKESLVSVAIDEGLLSKGMLSIWIKKHKEMDYNIVERKRDGSIMPKKTVKPSKNETIEEKVKRLEKENLYLKAELDYSKKIESRCSSKEESTTEEKVNVISELRLTYPLMILLQVSGLAKSVYYYTLSKIDKDDKNKEIIEKIKEIFINNKERYGYRRITLKLRNQGYNMLIIKKFID